MLKVFYGHRAKYELTVIHKAAILVLAVLGFFFLFHQDVYRLKIEYNPEEMYVPFLKAGDYEVKIMYCGASEGNYAVASSDLTADSENCMGVEFARTELRAGIRDVAVLRVHLDQGTYGLRIWSEKPDQCFEEITLQRVQLLDRDNYFLFAVCVMSALVIAFLGRYMPAEKYRNAFLLAGIGLAASVPMFSDFLLKGHDLLFHLSRMEGLYQGLCNGEFPVRITPTQTELFGSLTATMYPQLFLYPAVLPRFLDVSVMLCYKMLVVCINIATAVFAFYGVRRVTASEKTAFVASILYEFSLYRLTNIYLRAALGEALAMALLPLVLWGAYEVFWGNYKKNWYLLALGMTCVLQSHLLSVVMAAGFLLLEAAVWLVNGIRKKKAGGELLGRIGAGIGATMAVCLLNAGFLIPFLSFRKEKFLCFALDYCVADFETYFSQMFSFFSPATGVALVKGTTKGEMPLTVGGILAVGAILFLAAAFREKKRSRAASAGMHCLVYGGISMLLASWVFPWDRLGRVDFVRKLAIPLQYSWRFLGIASLCLCVVSAVGVVLIVSQKNGRNWILGIYMAVALCSAWFFLDSLTQMDPVNDEMELEGNTDYDNLYLYDVRELADPVEFDLEIEENYIKTLCGTQVQYSGYQKKGTDINVHVALKGKMQKDEYLIFPLYYYPGYEILADGQKVEAVPKGTLLACRLPEEAYIQVSYKGMGSWRIAEAISLIAALGIGGYIVWQRMAERKERDERKGMKGG